MQDMHMQHDDWGISKFPFIPGHEVTPLQQWLNAADALIFCVMYVWSTTTISSALQAAGRRATFIMLTLCDCPYASQVVGVVRAYGSNVKGLELGQRVGMGWIKSSCRRCAACLRGEENICDVVGAECDGWLAVVVMVVVVMVVVVEQCGSAWQSPSAPCRNAATLAVFTQLHGPLNCHVLTLDVPLTIWLPGHTYRGTPV
jgi:hypothetical protein